MNICKDIMITCSFPEVSLRGGILKGEGSLDLCLSSGVGLSSLRGVLLLTSFRSSEEKSFLSKLSFMMLWLISVSRSLLSL